MSSAFDYDDLIGGYNFPNSGYEAVAGGSKGGKEAKPRIILMGLRRSGKTSISSVVFAKLSPSESLFLESTTRVYKQDVSSR
jgi:hypothetical protein